MGRHQVTVTSRDATIRTVIAGSPLDTIIPWADVSVRMDCDGMPRHGHPEPRPMVLIVSQSINGCEWETLGVFRKEEDAEEHANSHAPDNGAFMSEWMPTDVGRERESWSGTCRQRIESWDVL